MNNIKNTKNILNNVIDTYNFTGKTIMIVDDDRFGAEISQGYLKNTGATILFAKDGAAAVNMVNDVRVDLVLMDVIMPVMNGYDATRAIRKTHPELPIIMHTAYGDQYEKPASIAVGCNDHLSKPVNPKEFLDMIVKYI